MPTDSGAPHLLPYPEPTDPPDVAGDLAKLAERVHTRLDAVPQDPAIILGDATKPSRYVGEGRPDIDTGVHTADEWTMLQSAPVGSSYICTNPDDFTDGTGNWGAYRWSKNPAGWQCVEGDTGHRIWFQQSTHSNSDLTGPQNGRIWLRRTAHTLNVSGVQLQWADSGQENGTWAKNPPLGWGAQANYERNTGVLEVHQAGAVTKVAVTAIIHVTSRVTFRSTGAYGGNQYGGITVLPEDVWPTAGPAGIDDTRSIEELQQLIDDIKNDPEKAEQLEQLKQELAELQADKQKD